MIQTRDTEVYSSRTISEDPNPSIDSANFKLTMYVSFASFNEAIGYKLMDSLHKFNERRGRDNFKLIPRLLFEGINERKWDEQFIEQELFDERKFDLEKITRIWVCGPPSMNQLFDKAFESLRAKKGSKMVPAEKIDIM